MNDRLSVGLVCEQLLSPVPGGIGTYVRALRSTLPAEGVRVVPVAAWHRRYHLVRAGLVGAHRLPLPRRALHEAWSRTGRPRIRVEVDVLHAPSLAFPTSHHGPLVVTVHDVLFIDFPQAYPPHGLDFHRRSLLRLGAADLIICPSEATAAVVSAVSAPKAIRVVPLGTDLDPPPNVDQVLRDLGIQQPYVLCVGTLEPRKNLQRAIGAFLAVARSRVTGGDRLKLYLAGPKGWLSDPIVDLLGRDDVRQRVRWLGPIARDQLAAAYAGAEVFLFPSLGEGFGLPVLEAMRCGAPVVTSDRSSLPEVAGEAALLCDPTDEASIASALTSVISNPQLAARLRRLGSERAAEFTWERTARGTAACYHEVVRARA